MKRFTFLVPLFAIVLMAWGSWGVAGEGPSRFGALIRALPGTARLSRGPVACAQQASRP